MFAIVFLAAAFASPFGGRALAAPAGAQVSQTTATFTGKWVATITTPQAGTRETIFFLTQTGDSLSGAVLTGYRMQNISEANIAGDEATWVVVTQYGDQQRRVNYHAQITGDQLVITISGTGFSGGSGATAGGPGNGRGADAGGRGGFGGGGGPQTLTAKRVSTDGTPVSPFADLPKIALPPLHAVGDGGLAQTPPMGWNSWNLFKAQVTDTLVRQVADAMVSSGMKDAGYVYVNIDDTWEGTRDANGNIQSNSRFPDMKALADYIHSKGLKFGIYSSPGPKTCGGYEGSYGHEQQDATTWASWGVDYVKYDWCSAAMMYQPEDEQAAYQLLGAALRATGRPMVFSTSSGVLLNVQTWGALTGANLWRTTSDIRDTWQSMSSNGFDKQIGLDKYAGPGHWNDPDMLEIGNGGMTDTEYRTHMSLWAILAAPLLAGNDPRSMTQSIHDILTNGEVIAIDQDKAGREGYRLTKDGDKEVWVRPMANGDWVVGLFNRGDSTANITVKWADLKISGKQNVRDVWRHADIGPVQDAFSVDVPSHGVVVVRVAP
jgi:alpha-galactosidase